MAAAADAARAVSCPNGVNFLSFWGKAQPLHPDGPGWHSAAFHCLDVAAVGEALLTRHGGLGDALARLLCLSSAEALRLACFLLCLHDIGKFAKKFQAKAPHLYPECFGDDPARVPGRYDHGVGALRLFDADPGLFNLPRGTSNRVWRPLISAIFGHHGSPPSPRLNEGLLALRPDYGTSGIEAARQFIQQAHALFPLPPELPALDRPGARRASFLLAGIAVLADWIGSSQRWFPYRGWEDFEAYWEDAQSQAARAVAEAGVLPARPRDHLDYGDLIGADATPSPMQDWAQSVELPPGPMLCMIEDETGSGKTEAAVMLAHRLMAPSRGEDRADGLYVALPTMATANAMFDRLAAAHRHLFSAGAAPSIALVHGAREMHEGFRAAMVRGGRDEALYSRSPDLGDESDTTASAACAAWIADDRRRAFLADAGAGSVDQALLSVLPSRHQSLRLLGLSRRVLILDEVHAYDAYMQREMETLLEFQAGLGGSAILLSATLPVLVRRRLADAFKKGLGERGDHDPSDHGLDYPLVTVCARDTRTLTKVSGRPGRARALPVRFLRSPEEGLAEVEQAALAGKAVLYIRNTVDDALDAHAELRARGLDPDLFHARFALADRLAIEKHVTKTFGKASTPAGRVGRVLIATQVVEQSLDLDFDALVTDLAPIDLLIQRAGRLWRHDRRERAGRPELLVVAPVPEPDAKSHWFSDAFPRTAYVYTDHARLWLTARTLQEAGLIDSPGGLRPLIEAVYGDGAIRSVPDGLQASFVAAEGKAGEERGIATTNLLDLTKGFVRDGGAWDSDARTPTRLADEPQVTLRLAHIRDGRMEPLAHKAAPDESWRAWRLSEVSVTARRVSGEAVPPEYAEAAREAKRAWTRFDSDRILVVLERTEVDDSLSGSVVTLDGATALVTYDSSRGLAWD